MKLKRFYLTVKLVLFVIIFVSLSKGTFLKYPFEADFDIKTARYSFIAPNTPALNLEIINYDRRSFDSLEIQIYFRARDGFENDLAASLRLCRLRNVNGSVDTLNKTGNEPLSINIAGQHPQKVANTFQNSDSTSAFALRIPLSGIMLNSQIRLIVDLQFIKNGSTDDNPTHQISNRDWSFGSHSQVMGDLIDFKGVDIATYSDIYYGNWLDATNYYITIYRNNKLLWGIPPDWQLYYSKDTFIPVDTRPLQDPMPYAQIAVPFNEFEEQLVRDSANIHISPIRINQAGYRPGDNKFFYCITVAASTFTVINEANGSMVTSGTLKNTGLTSSGQINIKASNNGIIFSTGDTRYILQGALQSGTVYEGKLPDLPEGRYRVVVGSDTSAPFMVHQEVYNMVKDALLKFYGVNRCGDSKSWFHPPCHTLDAVTGGWHDCGDHLKEGATQSYTGAVLGLAAAAFGDIDQDHYDADQSKTQITDGIPDVLYEAKHGADFVLRSYNEAGGQIDKMITSVGEYGYDRTWWGRPENQDQMPLAMGGPPRSPRREPTTDYLGKYAANLAFVSKKMRPYDAAYADKCLNVAKMLYEFTKPKLDNTSSVPYSGSIRVGDDAAFGCLALLWATEERKYLDELCFDTTIGLKAGTASAYFFSGGFFAHDDSLFSHSAATTGWSYVHTHVLWGFFKLILNDQELCNKLGLTERERLGLIEKTIVNLMANLPSVGIGTQSITLPDGVLRIPSIIKYDLPWFVMHTEMELSWNRYQAGNITDLFYYYDMAKTIEGLKLPAMQSPANWKIDEVKTVLIRMLDYMLGVNPWDISMIYGIGAKNFNHPQHRASNPELRNCNTEYHYRHLVGALHGGYIPTTTLYDELVADYSHSKVGIDGTTNILMPILGLCVKTGLISNRNFLKNHAVSAPVIQVLPNRTDGSFLIRSTKPLRSASLYTIGGRLVMQQKAAVTQPQSIQMRCHTGSGMYLLRVESEDGLRVTRTVSQTN